MTSLVTQNATVNTTAASTAAITNPAKPVDLLEAKATTVPAYASPCAGATRYSGICSYFCLNQATVTAAMLVSGSRFPPGLACAETSFQTSTSSVTITVAPTQGVSTPILVQTAATVAKMCHASPVVTGGLASGSFSPLGFKSFHSTMTGSGSSAVVVNDPSLANSGPYCL